MNSGLRGTPVDLDSWDLGDVLAIVASPQDFAVPDQVWRRERVVDAVVAAAGLGAARVAAVAAGAAAGAALPVVGMVPLVLLVMHTRRGARSQPHVALMAIDDARRLASRDALFFPEGGPTIGDVYARHPLRRRDYLPYADLHRLVLQEKSIEAARHLLSLGAQDVRIAWQQPDSKAAKGEAKATIPDAADISLNMGLCRDDSGQLTIHITGAGTNPIQPADLIWPTRDPMFKLASDAANAGAATFHFGIKHEQSRSVNAGIAASLEKDLNLGIGGEYKRWEDLVFTADASFRCSLPSRTGSPETPGEA